MFQFTGFAFMTYGFSHKYLLMISVSPKTSRFAPQAARPSHEPGAAFAPSAACATPGPSPPFPFKEHDDVDPALCAQIKLFRITEIEGGFPHSEIRGSKVVRTSPRLIAAYHVLHRLSAPRHPPNTLKALDRSHCRCPSAHPSLRTRRSEKRPHTFTSFVRLNRRLTTTNPSQDLSCSDRTNLLFTMSMEHTDYVFDLSESASLEARLTPSTPHTASA